MKNLITAIFSIAVIGISTCGKKGLDNTDNSKEKEHHENFQDSTDTDSSQGNLRFYSNQNIAML